jgi:F-type H+-transporting ATPase subunit gamma
MASLRDLRRRIKSTENMQKITKAMKAVAAAKMRRAQDTVLAARPYSKRMKAVLGRVAGASSGAGNIPLLVVRDERKVCYIIVTSDRGLCGGFNGNVIRMTEQELKKSNAEISLVTVGRKAYDYFRKRGYKIEKEYVGMDEIKYSTAREISNSAIGKYTEEEYDAVYVIFSEFINVMVQKPTMLRVLPAEPPEEDENAVKVNYIFEPPTAKAVLAELLPKYVENVVFQAMLESRAGEQSARMTAMDNATKNASDMISSMTLSMNRARQAAITSEISEIVGGAAALE